MKKIASLYMKTTNDDLELPVAVAGSPGELAMMLHTTSASVLSSISHHLPGWHRIIIEEEGEENDHEDKAALLPPQES